MNEGCFERVFRFLYRHPFAVAGALAGVGLMSLLGMMGVPHQGGLVSMLPENSRARRTVTFLRDANLADKVAVSVSADAPDADTADLTATMDGLAERFGDSPLVRRVHSFPGGDQMMEELVFFLRHAPELLSEEDLAGLEDRLTEKKIRQRIRRAYVRLLRPEGTFMQEILRHDPLGISRVLLKRLQQLPRSVGYQVAVQDGHLVHPDGRHGLLLMDSAVPLTDGPGSARLVDMLRSVTADVEEGYSTTVICGHLHTVSNERLLRRDIKLTVIVATIGFLALFLLVFRDPKAGAIFLIPAISILVAINGAALLIGRLSYMILGFAPVMAGIAVDYGIHSYVATRRADDPYPALKSILRPLLMGALTTQCVFVAFLLSSVPAYRELGGLAIVGITLAAVGAVTVLPSLVRAGGHETPFPIKRPGATDGRVPAVLFLLSLVGGLLLVPDLEVDTDLQSLDGVEENITRAEREFQELWGGGRRAQAIAVVGGQSFEEAARREDALRRQMAQSLPEVRYIGRSSIWPSRPTRERNLRRWREFWTEDRIQMVRRHVLEAGAEYGFAEDAFSPFFDLLTTRSLGPARPENSALFRQLEQRFVKERENGYWFMGFFPDSPGSIQAVSLLTDDLPETFIVSRQALAATLTEAVSTEGTRIAVISVVLILLVNFTLMRNVRMALAALLPAATGVLWLVVAMVLVGHALNLANMIAGIVVIGLCIDYGIFTAHARMTEDGDLRKTRHAITLSALTTLMGAGVLIFARHPALFSIGFTLVVGVFAGYAAAILGVPGLCRLLHADREG